MKLNPSQVAMYLYLGSDLPMMGKRTLDEKIAAGYEMLNKISKQDFGKNVLEWHNYLLGEYSESYQASNIHKDIEEKIELVKSSEEWLSAVSRICS